MTGVDVPELVAWVDWSRTFDVVLGAILAILFAIFVEWLRKPRLRVTVGATDTVRPAQPNFPIQEGKSLRVRVFAKPLLPGTRWMMRAPALQCRGQISFHHLDGQYLYDREMQGRWAGTPEPSQTVGIDHNGQPVSVLDPYKIVTPSRVDIAVQEEESLDVVARYDHDADCYGWSNESYLHHWRNPAWRIPAGRYLVRVAIRSGGQSWSGIFRLINDVPRNDFRLERSSCFDKLKVRRFVKLRTQPRSD